MFSFIFRLAAKAAVVQKFRFVSLTVTIIVATLLLVVLSALYLNGESQMAVELSGVPNMVIKPKNSSADLLPEGSDIIKLFDKNIKKIKSEEYFWHNNIVNATPIAFSEGIVNGNRVKIAGTWFNKNLQVDNQSYKLGMLRFAHWKYTGKTPNQNSVIIGSNVKLSENNYETYENETIKIVINGKEKTFQIAGEINTGSFWDNYIFIDSNLLSELTGSKGFDEILVSALFKPDDNLSIRAEREGENSLSSDEYEIWMCSPYISVVAQTMRAEIPNSEINVQRRITEVQAGIIKTSSGIFLALFILTLIASLTAIFSAEKMYVTSHIKDFGIMTALGASHKKIFIQLFAEISLSSFISAVIIYLISSPLVNYISKAVYGVRFEANSILIAAAIIIPLAVSSGALWFLRKSLKENIVNLLK